MIKLIESIGRWLITHNWDGIFIALVITVIIALIIYDIKTSD